MTTRADTLRDCADIARETKRLAQHEDTLKAQDAYRRACEDVAVAIERLIREGQGDE